MAHIFISYSHQDSEYAYKLRHALEQLGFEVWVDDRIDYGTRWPQVIEERLDACAVLIVIMTSRSKGSNWVQNELARAQSKGKPIFPLLLEGDNWLVVQATQYIDVRAGDLPPPDFYDRLRLVLEEQRARTPAPGTRQVTVDRRKKTAYSRPRARSIWLWAVGGVLAVLVCFASALGTAYVLREGGVPITGFLGRRAPAIAPLATPTATPTEAVEKEVRPTSTPTRVIEKEVRPTSTPTRVIEKEVRPTATPTRVIEKEVRPTSTPTRVIEKEVTRVVEKAVTRVVEKAVTRLVKVPLYSHDFDSDDGHWPLGAEENEWGTLKTSLTGGKYRYERMASETSVYRMCLRDRSFSDFALSVEATVVEGPVPFAYGIIFRKIEGEYKYYELRLNNQSKYKVQMRNNDYTELVDWTKSPAIKNEGTNRIDITAVDSTLSFSVNDQHLATVTDSTWRSGQVCFFMWLAGGKSAIVDFDNLRIYSATQ